VTDQFLLTENSHRVAVQLADRWATAVETQARRIRKPYNHRVTVTDQYLQVVALHHVLVAAKMARAHVLSESARPRIDAAINAFLKAIVVTRGPGMNQRQALRLARDVLEHFDEYLSGTGKKQREDQARTGESKEDLAQRYRLELGTTAQPTLRIGSAPLAEIDLADVAPAAARQLVEALCAIVGVDVLPGFGTAPLHHGGEQAD
jgi:hypothetical protein